MRRLTPLLLLLLVLAPLTMAPRTSLDPVEEVDLEVYAAFSRQSLPRGGPVSIVLQVKNTSSLPLRSATLTADMLWKGIDVAFVAMSPGCEREVRSDSASVQCALGALEPGQQRTVHLALNLTGDGSLQVTPTATGMPEGLAAESTFLVDGPLEVLVGTEATSSH